MDCSVNIAAVYVSEERTETRLVEVPQPPLHMKSRARSLKFPGVLRVMQALFVFVRRYTFFCRGWACAGNVCQAVGR